MIYCASTAILVLAHAGSEQMRVTIATEGGLAYFPGLAKPVVIETDQLDPVDAARLGDLIEAARFFEQPKQVGQAALGAADLQRHTVTIELKGRQHTVEILEPINDVGLRELVRFLQQQVRELRAKARGAAPR
jgi:hypothetical protein